MLGRAIQYEVSGTYREFLLFYGVMAAVFFLIPFLPINESLAPVIFLAIAMTLFILVGVGLFRLFNQNIYGEPGYLTMTLPISTLQLIWVKLVVGVIWLSLTFLVGRVSLWLGANLSFMSYNAPFPVGMDPGGDFVQTLLNDMMTQTDFSFKECLLFLLLFSLRMLSSLFQLLAAVFLACVTGHLEGLRRLRIPFGILTFFLLERLFFLMDQVIGLTDLNDYIDKNGPGQIGAMGYLPLYALSVLLCFVSVLCMVAVIRRILTYHLVVR